MSSLTIQSLSGVRSDGVTASVSTYYSVDYHLCVFTFNIKLYLNDFNHFNIRFNTTAIVM